MHYRIELNYPISQDNEIEYTSVKYEQDSPEIRVHEYEIRVYEYEIRAICT